MFADLSIDNRYLTDNLTSHFDTQNLEIFSFEL